MPIGQVNGKDVIGVVFDRSVFDSLVYVDMWMSDHGYDPYGYSIDVRESGFRLLLPNQPISTYDQSTIEQVDQSDAGNPGVSFILGSPLEAYAFNAVRFAEIGQGIEAIDIAGATTATDGRRITFCGLYQTGKFNHGGKVVEILPIHLEQMLANFKSNAVGKKIPINYSHEDHKLAAGWVTEVTLNKERTKLYLTVEFTPSAFQAIQDKEWAYFSGEFWFDYKNENGQSCGACLVGGALTNIPALKQASLGTFTQILDKLFLSQKEPPMPAEKTNLTELQTKLDAAEQKITELTESLKTVNALAEENKTLKADNAKSAADLKVKEKTLEFEKLRSTGNAVEAQRECFMKDDMIGFAKLAKKVNVVTNINTGGNGEENVDGEVITELSDPDKAYCRESGISEEAWLMALNAEKSGRNLAVSAGRTNFIQKKAGTA